MVHEMRSVGRPEKHIPVSSETKTQTSGLYLKGSEAAYRTAGLTESRFNAPDNKTGIYVTDTHVHYTATEY
jgi:hypothetical protein